jgi:hypothetical protein
LFENWKGAYNEISRAGKGGVTQLISKPLEKSIDKQQHDLFVPHRAAIPISASRQRGSSLPKTIFVPKAKVAVKKKNETVAINLTLCTAEARLLATYYGLEGQPSKTELAQEIKSDVLRRAGKRSRLK